MFRSAWCICDASSPATRRNGALDALTFVLSQVVDGKIPISVLPDSPTALAAPLQRIYLSSEARDKSTLKASLLGVLGLLLQLIGRYNPAAADLQPHGNLPASRPAGAAGVSGVEDLNRHWLLQMCRGELSGVGGELSSAKGSEGTVEGMTAALCLMQVGLAGWQGRMTGEISGYLVFNDLRMLLAVTMVAKWMH